MKPVEPFNKFFRRAIRSGREVVGPIDAAQQIERRGGIPDPEEHKTTQQRIWDRFRERSRRARAIHKQLPKRLRYALPVIEELHEEIHFAILSGCYGAAITLCGVLVEHVLKHAIFIKGRGEYSYDQKEWAEFEKKHWSLKTAINRARDERLFPEPAFYDDLVKFHDTVRNPYSHFNIQQIVGGFVVRAIEVGCDSRTQKRLTIRAEEDIAVQAIAKREIDARHVIGHYHWATRIVRDVLQVLHQRIGDDPVQKRRSQLGANMVDFKVLALVRCERPNGPQVIGIDTRNPGAVKRRPKRRRRSSGA